MLANGQDHNHGTCLQSFAFVLLCWYMQPLQLGQVTEGAMQKQSPIRRICAVKTGEEFAADSGVS